MKATKKIQYLYTTPSIIKNKKKKTNKLCPFRRLMCSKQFKKPVKSPFFISSIFKTG